MEKIPRPPIDLSNPGKKLWKALRAEYAITDPAGLMYLTTGCRHFDRMEQARHRIAREGLMTNDRFKQKKPHPAVQIERDASASMLRAFAALNLDLEPLKDRAGRPPGK